MSIEPSEIQRKPPTIKNLSQNPLPPDTKVGSTVTFKDTIASSGEFGMLTMLRISQDYGLDPNKDYEEIVRLSKDPNVSKSINEKLTQDSSKSYEVIGQYAAPSNIPGQVLTDFDDRFFSRFDYLENSGQEVVGEDELGSVDRFYIGGGLTTTAFANMEKSGVYGDMGDSPTYFSTDHELAMTHMEDDHPVLIEISAAKLQQYRTIFRDPESLYVDSESGKTFIDFHGIPAEAVIRILLLKKVTN